MGEGISIDIDVDDPGSADKAVAIIRAEIESLGLTRDELLDEAAIMTFLWLMGEKLGAMEREAADAHNQTSALKDQALEAQKSAITHLRDALGLAPQMIKTATISGFTAGIKHGKAIAPKKGANKMHEENRAMKQQAFAWFDEHSLRHASMDDAAMAAMKVVPMKFSTLRAWMTEWKKLRSAGRP